MVVTLAARVVQTPHYRCLPYRLSLRYQNILPLPTNGEGRSFRFTLPLCHCPCSPSKSSLTLVLKTKRRTTYSALLWSYVPLAPCRLLRHVHPRCENVDRSQRPMNRHGGRHLPLINVCARLLPLLTTATLIPLFLISIENFPVLGKLYYGTAQSSFHSKHDVHLTPFFFSFQSFHLPLCFQIIPSDVFLTNNDTVPTKPHIKLENLYFTRIYTITAYPSSCMCYSSPTTLSEPTQLTPQHDTLYNGNRRRN